MKYLVVTAHPLSKSLCKLLTDHVIEKLTAMGHDVVVEDLYAEKFAPSLTEAERKSYYDNSYDSSKISEQTKRLLEADGLILIFPTWWFSFPAILKGWFDRVWGPGIAYNHAQDFGPICPRLKKLKKTLVITTLGAPWWVDRLIMWQPVKRVIKIAILGTCAPKSSLEYLSLYKSEKLNEEIIGKFKQKIDKIIGKWKV